MKPLPDIINAILKMGIRRNFSTCRRSYRLTIDTMGSKHKECLMRSYRYGLTAVIAMVLLLAACASYNGRGLQPGIATEDDVRHLMGTPMAIFFAADGGKSLAYPHGPVGLETHMARIDRNGRLIAIEQVLEERHFTQIQHGLDEDAVNWLLGPPWRRVEFPRRQEIAWDYRYRDLWGYVATFSVIFGNDGKVKTTVNVRDESRFPFFL